MDRDQVRCPRCDTVQGEMSVPRQLAPGERRYLPLLHIGLLWVCYRCGFEWVE